MAASNIVTLTKENFAAEAVQSAQPILIDFWAEWCGPCKALAPVLDELATAYAGKARIGKVNVDENQELAAQYGVQNIPMLIILKNGQVVESFVGLRSKKDLMARLDSVTAAA